MSLTLQERFIELQKGKTLIHNGIKYKTVCDEIHRMEQGSKDWVPVTIGSFLFNEDASFYLYEEPKEASAAQKLKDGIAKINGRCGSIEAKAKDIADLLLETFQLKDKK